MTPDDSFKRKTAEACLLYHLTIQSQLTKPTEEHSTPTYQWLLQQPSVPSVVQAWAKNNPFPVGLVLMNTLYDFVLIVNEFVKTQAGSYRTQLSAVDAELRANVSDVIDANGTSLPISKRLKLFRHLRNAIAHSRVDYGNDALLFHDQNDDGSDYISFKMSPQQIENVLTKICDEILVPLLIVPPTTTTT